MLQWSFTDFVLRVLWHIIWRPGCCNVASSWNFYHDKTKTFYSFFLIYNLYVTFYRYSISEHCYVGENVVVRSSTQLFGVNCCGSWMECVSLVSTYYLAEILENLLENQWVLWINMINSHETWVYFQLWKIMIKVWVNIF